MRAGNRPFDRLRPINYILHYAKYAAGSVLFEIGQTRVLAAVSISNSVPQFLRGKGQGWLTASYSLLPMSCRNRVERESVGKRNERAVEISRLIGRSLRSVVSLECIGEKTIHVDCDVLQADGGTRAAAITAASLALKIAQERWVTSGEIKNNFIWHDIAAVSVGIVDGVTMIDLDYAEDARAHADFNFVMTLAGDIIEVQGTAEQQPICWQSIVEMRSLAAQGMATIFQNQKYSSSNGYSIVQTAVL
jgi:ribonuclease PH